MSEILSKTQGICCSIDEMDYREYLKPSAILQYFQDIATSHATDIGIGYEDMLKQNVFWILFRLSYRVEKNPALGEEIFVTTYPQKPRRVDSVRNYIITNHNGNRIILGTSKWCLIDISSRTIKRCDGTMNYSDDAYLDEEILKDGNAKIADINDIGSDIKKAYDFTVRITDLDRNKHMNNARYGDVVFNACSTEKLENFYIKAFDINFMSEMLLGDTCEIFTCDHENNTYFEAKKSDDTIVFRAKIEWEAR